MTRREPTFLDHLKAAFHCFIPVPGIGNLPINYMFLAVSAGMTIAYWPLSLFCSAIELAYLMAMASHPRFQAIIRAKILQENRKEEYWSREKIIESLSSSRDVREYENFCNRCDESLKISRNTFGNAGSSLLGSYEDNLEQFKLIYARMLLMRQNLSDNDNPRTSEDIRSRISLTQEVISNTETPEATRQSALLTLEILQKRLSLQTQTHDRLSHINAEIQRLNEEILYIRDQVVVNSISPELLADKVTTTSEVVQQHSEWLKDQGDLFRQLEEE